jgi:hypothetical protein
MKKLTAVGIVILLVVGLIPLLWYRDGSFIGNGDNIPPSLNAEKTFSSSANMWSPDYLGYASPNPAYLFDTYFAAALGNLGLSVGGVQIIIQILLYMGAGFAMYFFSKTIYPDHKIAPFFAAFFYLFNFFVLDSRFNIGFAWLYAFLPLLLALFVRTVNATYRQDKKSANVGVICFALVSVVALSLASVNPANIALFLFGLSVFSVYFLVKHRKNLSPFLFTIGKIVAVTIPINIWWMYPMLNTFIFSPAGLNSQVNVASWSWTHARSSFLNLFWFNGTWGWFPEYVSFIDYYKNPIVAILTFVPFLAAGAALFFKSNRSRFNAYIMGCVLCFLFLASGLHEQLASWLNKLLYDHFTLWSMFREPSSKFTLLIIPFVALLIGYLAESILNIKSLNVKLQIKPNRLKIIKVFILLFLTVSFVISSFPLLNTGYQLKIGPFFEPDSSYTQIPQYWFQATNWINSQPGDWNILLTPLNDFYQMNYRWGYYGSDQLLERLFDKPILSTDALDGYVTNPETSANLMQIRTSIKFNQTDEFKALLDLLNIKYIVQRNDVITDNYTIDHIIVSPVSGRNLKSPSEMHNFFAEQPYLKLIKTKDFDFDKLDIYEYTEAKPSIMVIPISTLQKTNIHIDDCININKTSIQNDIGWISIVSNKSQATFNITQGNNQLKVDMRASPNASIIVDSPKINVISESRYLINAVISSENVTGVELKIAEYSQQGTLLENWTLPQIDRGIFSGSFEPRTENTKYLNIQIWNNFGNETINSLLTINSLSVLGIVSTLNMTGIEYLYGHIPDSKSAQILQVTKINPEKIIINVNATQPFVLATTQTLDKFWVAYVNGQRVSPTTVYLGLKGFLLNETGQFDVNVVYQPQDWFNYCLTLSAATVLLLCIGLVYLNRKTIKTSLARINRQT